MKDILAFIGQYVYWMSSQMRLLLTILCLTYYCWEPVITCDKTGSYILLQLYL